MCIITIITEQQSNLNASKRFVFKIFRKNVEEIFHLVLHIFKLYYNHHIFHCKREHHVWMSCYVLVGEVLIYLYLLSSVKWNEF